jgi:hypothetical protein
MRHPTLICTRLMALPFFIAMASDLFAASAQHVLPPSMSKLAEAMVMAPLLDGKLIAVLDRAGPDGHQAIARYSSDGGRSWSEPETLFTLPKEMGNWGLHYLLVDHQGELHIFYQADAKTAGKGLYEMRLEIYHIGSSNGRKSWTAPVLVRKGYNGSLLSAVELKSGRIILPVCYLTPRTWSNRGNGFDAFTDMGRFSSAIMYSDDGGATWKQAAVELKVPSPYIGADGIIEPIAMELKDGRVWLLLRTQLGRFFESFSRDGAEWTKPTPTSILSSDSPPSLVRLKDGRMVMLWNNCLRFSYAQGGRHILHAAISADDGRTWHGYREVARNPFVSEPPPPNGDHGVSYTLPVLTNDGEIITPISVGGTGGMWLLRFNPDWLDETSRATDFAAGLDGWSSFGTKGVELITNPDKPNAQALQLRKPDADWLSAAVWNFPNGMKGRLKIRLKLNPGFAGARLGLTDHFSVPFDPEAECYNLFNLNIGADGKLKRTEITTGQWHTLEFEWNVATSECRVSVDGDLADTLPIQRRTSGVNYLRVTSTAETTDSAGLLIESVDVKTAE